MNAERLAHLIMLLKCWHEAGELTEDTCPLTAEELKTYFWCGGYKDDLDAAVRAAVQRGIDPSPIIRLWYGVGETKQAVGESLTLCERLMASLLSESDEEVKAGTETDLSPLEKALALLVCHPEWTDTQIADAVNVSRTTLYKPSWRRFQAAREMLRTGRAERAHGQKDPATGDVEASK